MRVEDNSKNFGFFNFPSNSHTSKEKISNIPGHISIKDGGETQLEIFIDKYIEFKDRIPRITGRVDQMGFVVLDNCCQAPKTITSEMRRFTFTVKRVLFTKKLYKSKGEIHYDTFSFQVEGLNQWISHKGTKLIEPDKVGGDFNFEHKKFKNTICNLDNSIKLSFESIVIIQQCNTHKITHSNTHITETVFCKLISSEPRPLKILFQ